MGKYQKSKIGEVYITKEELGGYEATVIDGGEKPGYCVIKINDWIKEVRYTQLKRGSIKYPYHPSVYGVGFSGEGKYKNAVNRKQTKEYQTWRGMLGRCYYSKYQEMHHTYIGCTVHKDWHNFQTFAKWFEANYIEGYQLDKDKLVDSNKLYSEENCCFISSQENSEIANAKTYKFINPNGEIIEIYNLNKFCKENNLDQGNMSQVHSGKINQCKRIYYI